MTTSPPWSKEETTVIPLQHLIVAATLLRGNAAYYAPGAFDGVVSNRIAMRQITAGQCSECIGYAALMDERYIGHRVWIINETGWHGPILVVDCAREQDRATLRDKWWAIDVDYDTGKALGIVQAGRPLPVIVLIE